MIDLVDIVDGATIAERLGVTRAAVTNWKNRGKIFPLPTSTSTPVYYWPDVVADLHL